MNIRNIAEQYQLLNEEEKRLFHFLQTMWREENENRGNFNYLNHLKPKERQIIKKNDFLRHLLFDYCKQMLVLAKQQFNYAPVSYLKDLTYSLFSTKVKEIRLHRLYEVQPCLKAKEWQELENDLIELAFQDFLLSTTASENPFSPEYIYSFYSKYVFDTECYTKEYLEKKGKKLLLHTLLFSTTFKIKIQQLPVEFFYHWLFYLLIEKQSFNLKDINYYLIYWAMVVYIWIEEDVFTSDRFGLNKENIDYKNLIDKALEYGFNAGLWGKYIQEKPEKIILFREIVPILLKESHEALKKEQICLPKDKDVLKQQIKLAFEIISR